jgi:hypothetical protein
MQQAPTGAHARVCALQTGGEQAHALDAFEEEVVLLAAHVVVGGRNKES